MVVECSGELRASSIRRRPLRLPEECAGRQGTKGSIASLHHRDCSQGYYYVESIIRGKVFTFYKWTLKHECDFEFRKFIFCRCVYQKK